MAVHDGFPAEEFGSGSRPTPLVDAPSWLKAMSQRELSEGDRATLTPDDRAFLENPPTYTDDAGGEGESQLPPELLRSRKPSTTRRVLSLLLFVAIAGSASAVLALAVLRSLGHALFR